MTFTRRRGAYAAVTLLLAGGIVWGARLAALHLYPLALFSGWLLFGLLLGLTMFSLRKKLPFLPLGRGATWLRVHAVVGVLSVLLFGAHVGWRTPRGLIESALFALCITVAVSGLLGLWLSRTLARRLATRGQEVIYERIPALRLKIRREADARALAVVAETGSDALAHFYSVRLLPFFERPRNSLAHLLRSDRPRRLLLGDMAAFERYLSPAERERLDSFRELIGIKDDLDYHLALQGVLKTWQFVHVPLSWGLLLLGAVHGVLAQVFAAGLR